VQISRDSLRKFLIIFLGIDVPHHGYHQTLTFGRDITERDAKDLLNRLFRKLGRRKRYRKMTAIYVRERQPNNEQIHFHVRFMFFGVVLPFSPSVMVERFGAEVFEAWNDMNCRALNRRGNLLREQPHVLSYLIKQVAVPPRAQKTARPETIWWGRWNWKVLKEHYSKPQKQLVATALRNHCDQYKLPKVKPYYSMAWLRKAKKDAEDWADLRGTPPWEDYKRLVTRRKGKVSDKDFLAFQNGWSPWKGKSRLGASPKDTVARSEGEFEDDIL